MLYFSETMLFPVRPSSAKEFDFDFCVSTQSSVLFWSRLMTCSLRVSLLFDLSIKLLSELMILSSALMNSRFAADFGLRGREKFYCFCWVSRCYSTQLNDQTANSKAYIEVISFHNTQIKHCIAMLINNSKLI